MNYLLIDTSTFKTSVGVADEKSVIFEKSSELKSDDLLVVIDEVLKKGNVSKKELRGVIIYLGPGSYTGLRVCVSVANAFSYGLNIPIAGVKGKSFGAEKFNIAEMKPQDLQELLKKALHPKGAKLNTPLGCKFVTPFYGKEPNVGSN